MDIYDVRLYTYVLMNNHFHLLLETPLGNLGEFMRRFNIAYTGSFNRRHRRTGHLYQGRYKSLLVEKDAYLSVLSRYIHLNPVKIQKLEKLTFEAKEKVLAGYVWSSLPGYLKKRRRVGFVDYSVVLSEYGGDTETGRRAYGARIREGISRDTSIQGELVGQSILGGEPFVEWVKDHFLRGRDDRETPAIGRIQRYRAFEEVVAVLERGEGKPFDEIVAEKGPLRQIAMELLYRVGGMTGREIGELMGVGYTSVSQERRRLHLCMRSDKKLRYRLEQLMSQMKN